MILPNSLQKRTKKLFFMNKNGKWKLIYDY